MKRMIIITIFLFAFVIGCTKDPFDIDRSGNTVTVFKSEMCGCCVGYISELEKNGFDVNVVIMDDMAEVKSKFNIPLDMQSCHTAVVGNYFIEGHVPIEAVNKLLKEKPDIDGIALPKMLAGSPGMPGEKTEPFKILSITNGNSKEYITI